MTDADHYAVLHVSEQATTEEIQRNYRRLVKAFHPDTGDGDTRVAAEVTAAWHVLKDPVRRADYDARRRAAAGRATRDTQPESDSDPWPSSPEPSDAWGAEAGWESPPPNEQRLHGPRPTYQPPSRLYHGPQSSPATPWVNDAGTFPSPHPHVDQPPQAPSSRGWADPSTNAHRAQLKRRVPEYVTGATRAAAVAGICWAFLSLFPIAGALVREPAQNVTFVAQGAVTVLTSAVLARRRILRRRLSKLYLLWVLASLALVVGGLVAARTAAPASWFLPGYAAVWTVSYVVMTELRRRDLRSLLGNFPHY